MELGKEILPKVGVMIIVLIVFIGLSVVPGYSSSVSPIKQEIGKDILFSGDCWMGVEDKVGYPGDTVVVNVTGEWTQTISGFNIGMHYDPNSIEIDISDPTAMKQGTIAEGAFIFQPIIHSSGVFSIGAAWFPGSYPPAGTGILFKLFIEIFEDAPAGDYILDLECFGGAPPVPCGYTDEYGNGILDALYDGTLSILEDTDCSMWIDNMTVEPGETYTIPIYGSWSSTISMYSIGIQYDPSKIAIDISNTWAMIPGTVTNKPSIFIPIIPIPGLLSIGAAWFPGNYPSAQTECHIINLFITVNATVTNGNTILDLGVFGGEPPVECAFSDVNSNVYYCSELFDGILTTIGSDCGDLNDDGIINIADLTYLISYLYQAGPTPSPLCIGDINRDGIVNISDLTYLITYLYSGGPAPVSSCCG